MYFSFFKLKKWGKKAAEARRHNCAVLLKAKKVRCLPLAAHLYFYCPPYCRTSSVSFGTAYSKKLRNAPQ